MCKLVNIRSFLVLTAALVVALVTGCSERGPGGSDAQIEGNLVISIERSPAETLGLVQFYVLTVSGSDMETIADTSFSAINGLLVFDLEVPIGERRIFVLEGVRGGTTGSPQVIYRGQTIAPVRPGAITTLNLTLLPVVSMVRLSPIQTLLLPGEVLELQVEIHNIPNLAAISIDFRWPWEILGDNITVELSDHQRPDVNFYSGYEGSWMSLTVADTMGGIIVNQDGNGVLANISLLPPIQVEEEPGLVPFGIFEVDTVWSFTILGENTIPEVIFYEDSEFRLLPVPDREVQFPDAVLLEQVRRVTGVQAPTQILLSDVLPVSYFSVVDISGTISDLSGIENMVNLYSLNISFHPVEDLTPLASLIRLTSLNATETGTVSLVPLVGLANLEYLWLSENSITNIIPLSALTKLRTVDLSINDISNITPLFRMSKLTELDLSDNRIIEISVLEELPDLWWVDLSNNQITDILPLVNNSDLNTGSTVELWGNAALANDPIQLGHVETLRARGVTVHMSPAGR